MRKLSVCVALAAVVLFTGTAWADEYEVTTAIPTIPQPYGYHRQQPDPFRAGSFANPYIIRSRDTGREWEVRPTIPSTGGRHDPFQPGTALNPYTVRER